MEEMGKPIPRIAPILEWLQGAANGRIALLINSDIYPAAHSCRVFDSLLGVAPAVALTREETPAFEDYDIDCLSPYRGGIDAFAFNPTSLEKTNLALAELPASRAMCFGVPGWDYLLGAVIEQASVGGVVMDSGLLLHQSHETTYTDINDFEQFSPSVAALAGLEDGDCVAVAEAYAQRVETSCKQWGQGTDLIRSMHFAPVSLEQTVDPAARRIASILCDRIPMLTWSYQRPGLVGLIALQLGQSRPSFYSLCNFFLRSKAKERKFLEVLVAIACGLGCATTNGSARPLPDGHERDVALIRIRDATGGDTMQRRLEIAYLFGAELIDHASFDADLFAELALFCANDDERDAVDLIGIFLDRLDHAA